MPDQPAPEASRYPDFEATMHATSDTRLTVRVTPARTVQVWGHFTGQAFDQETGAATQLDVNASRTWDTGLHEAMRDIDALRAQAEDAQVAAGLQLALQRLAQLQPLDAPEPTTA